MKSGIYPNYPEIAKHFRVGVIRLLNYQVWENCFVVKIAGIGLRFVSKTFTRKTVKSNHTVSKPSLLYRVVRTWNSGQYGQWGDLIESVLLQVVGTGEKPFWDKVFLHQKVERDDVMYYWQGNLIKSPIDYQQALEVYQ